MIEIKTLEYDGDYDLRIGMRFDSGICSSYLAIYGQVGLFNDFAKELIDFPFRGSKKISFQYGDDDNKSAYFLLLDIELYDPSEKGKIVIKTLVDNKGNSLGHYRCKFPIFTDVQTINELGRNLLNWKPIEGEVWTFPKHIEEYPLAQDNSNEAKRYI